MLTDTDGKVNGRPHFVPLCRQALALLNEIKPLTGQGMYVFPSTRTQSRPMFASAILTRHCLAPVR